MGPDVLRRVRWGNVALAAAVVAALVAAAAWPRLNGPPPALPGDSAKPLVRIDDGPVARRPAKPAPRLRPGRRREEPARRSRTPRGGGARGAKPRKAKRGSP